MKKPEVILLIGIQAAGKSTFYKQRFFNTHVRLNLDMLKTRHREKLIFEACLDAKQPVVIDNTNVTFEDRQRYIPAAREAGCLVTGYFFEPDVEACVRRNAGRPEKERIPLKGIYATFKNLEPPDPKREPFDRLFVVRVSGDERFTEQALVFKSDRTGTAGPAQ